MFLIILLPDVVGRMASGDSRRALLESGKALEIRVHRRTDLSGISDGRCRAELVREYMLPPDGLVLWSPV